MNESDRPHADAPAVAVVMPPCAADSSAVADTELAAAYAAVGTALMALGFKRWNEEEFEMAFAA